MYEPGFLFENIKKYRRLRGLTQQELAEKLFVTAQNVSKWETGKSMPELENLCRLAEALGVSVDTLLSGGEEPAGEKVFLAADGGGTKTEFVLFTQAGKILKRLVLGGSNPNSVGLAAAQAVMQKGVDTMLAEGYRIGGFYAGVAGCINGENNRSMLAFLKKNYPDLKIDLKTDIYNVVSCTEHSGRSIAVICGTGSIVYAKTEDGLQRLGGWGYLFDSGGSGYDFGRDAVCAALAENDGFGPATLLKPMLEEELGGNVWDKINVLYTYPKEKIASFAGLVFAAYAKGDAVAGEIIEKNMSRLAFLINRAVEQYNAGPAVVISGGLTAQKDVLLPFLQKKLPPQLQLIFLDVPQIYGACARCCRLFGEREEGFKENFMRGYAAIKGEENHAEN